ncbi:MAG TPA: DUF3830 family protein [Lacipirellulaceae bacterium]|nr:DUF3830 family protein [Lacipirellulaceae bacterium]
MDRRKIRLTFVNTGESVLAEMLDDEAPEVCRIVWDLLPAENRSIHGQFSGAEVFILLENPQPVSPENLTQIPLPGEILYFYDANKSVMNPPHPIAEICLVYNRGVLLRGAEGYPTTASLFARIPGDWKYDWTAFRNACRRSRTEGPQLLRIERA